MLKKKDARDAKLEIGAFGKIVCGRYVQFLSDVTDTTIKGIEYDIPARSRSRGSQKNSQSSRSQSLDSQITEGGVLNSTEQYKKRTPRGKRKSAFFTQDNPQDLFYKEIWNEIFIELLLQIWLFIYHLQARWNFSNAKTSVAETVGFATFANLSTSSFKKINSKYYFE